MQDIKYEDLSPQEQWAEDKRLGILDAPDREEALKQLEDPNTLDDVVQRWLAGETAKASDYQVIALALSRPRITHEDVQDAHAQGYALGQQTERAGFIAALEALLIEGPVDTLDARLSGLIMISKEDKA